MELNKSGIDAALTALGEYLDYVSSESFEIIVCGGSALQSLGLINRTTRDVDVLAFIKIDALGMQELIPSEPLPEIIISSAAFVARDLKLPENWFNSGPSDLTVHGLPEGITERFSTQEYGERLCIHFIGRLDQICFKTYASVCDGENSRHLNDLLALYPTDEEMLFASEWCLKQDASIDFPYFFKSFLIKTGFSYVTKQIDL